MAAEKTADEAFFPKHDVNHAIRCLMEKVNSTNMSRWAGGTIKNPVSQKILCLHAGNLPLVGFQDALACLLSGVDYYGKISRKDPYLLPGFLEQFKGSELDKYIHYSLKLEDFRDLKADAVTFSGSNESVPVVKHIISKNNIVKPNGKYLIRTANFSMAYLDQFNEENAKDLVEAILRYDGKGCRSVAVIVSPIDLSGISCTFTDFFESYWLKNPSYRKPTPKTTYRFAYNKAVNKKQMLPGHLIVEENEPTFNNDDIISWIKGGTGIAARMANQFGDRLQNIYVSSPEIKIPGFGHKTELIKNAQCPDLDWRPDGVDILKWINSLS